MMLCTFQNALVPCLYLILRIYISIDGDHQSASKKRTITKLFNMKASIDGVGGAIRLIRKMFQRVRARLITPPSRSTSPLVIYYWWIVIIENKPICALFHGYRICKGRFTRCLFDRQSPSYMLSFRGDNNNYKEIDHPFTLNYDTDDTQVCIIGTSLQSQILVCYWWSRRASSCICYRARGQ